MRHHQAAIDRPADGVSVRHLYGGAGPACRAGEPSRVVLVELQPGANWSPHPGSHAPAVQREWLVLEGQARLGAALLGPLDYRATTSRNALATA